MKDDISDYSQSEFFQLVNRICVEDYATEQEHIDAVLHFEEMTGHPDGSDLIYYPENPEDGTPENIVKIVKEWRFSQGLPCFKN
ncbi:bacteriocin immunity protein [Vibrio cholerae]|uniref:bacteriocin immunity protein n=1 Tax=Vibrio TaxID=662 RepID=UPI00037E59BC|nr:MULTISPECIES: bacteriocin immunity protein [Vibrio]EGQ7978156.1 bacteriocin immunity protein [Vibrio cholerae]EGQ8531117.1 bacteriocin immunity protein [Vibrio cholerae]EGQ8558976.1 bacteriocin immunity protein [Vibrio cholerae]EKF9303089.1 bacteriocin immunity protein [Vibrio cholerae]ELH4196555.1 bacteriocin immunity protein [Vibrio cholerae]